METFVVRAWRAGADGEPSGDGDDTLRGVVEHVASGTSIPFRDADQLVTFLRSSPGGGVHVGD